MKQTLWQRLRERAGLLRWQAYKLLRYGRLS